MASEEPRYWHVRMLGRLELRSGAACVRRFRTQKTASLLAYLAVNLGRPCTRETLADVLWPESDPEQGQNSLRVELHWLRRLLEPTGIQGGHVLVAGATTISLSTAAVSTDVAAFEAAIERQARAADPLERAALLEHALEAYGGPLLPGVYDDWVFPERDRLADAYTAALLDLVEILEAHAPPRKLIPVIRRALVAEPLREDLHRRLIRALASSGQVAAALRHYDRYRQALAEEIGQQPSEDLQSLVDELRGEGQQSVARPRAAARKRLGARRPPATHRPASRDEHAGTQVVALPSLLTRFYGRDALVDELCGQLAAGAHRLVTLLGPVGSGKTRLAIEVGRRYARDTGGSVWFVPLSETADAGGVLAAVCAAVGAAAPSDGQAMQTASAAVPPGPSLLILDNFEQLPDDAADVVQRLMEAAPGLACLVTSRRAIRLMAEATHYVAPLPTPDEGDDPSALAAVASVQLLVDRARRVCPDFQVSEANAAEVARLCRRLDGLPLAIELAAAWAGSLSPRQMLARMDRRADLLVSVEHDRPARHRSLRAALAESFDMLSPQVQAFAARLCVFRGGCTLEAAEQVCEEPHALAALRDLVASSLLHTGEGAQGRRHYMLETVRDYAAGLPDPMGHEASAPRHAAYFLALAEEARQHIRGRDQAAWVQRLGEEYPNLREALAWQEQHAPDDMLRLAAALSGYWYVAGRADEGRAWLERALRAGSQSPRGLRAEALNAAGTVASAQGDVDAARLLLEESAAEMRALGDALGAAGALNNLGMLCAGIGGHEQAREWYRQSLALFEENDAPDRAAVVRGNLAVSLTEGGDPGAAQALLERNLERYRQQGNDWMAGTTLNNLAELSMRLADDRRAMALAQEAVRVFGALGAGEQAASCLETLACIAAATGKHWRAACLLGAAVAVRSSPSPRHEPPGEGQLRSDVAPVRGALGEDRFTQAWTRGAAMTAEQAILYALDVRG